MLNEKLIAACQFKLATDFTTPALQIIGEYAAKLGLTSPELLAVLHKRCE